MKFNASPKHTVGVEWELQLLDSKSLDLIDGIIPLMEFFPDSEFVKPEYIQSSVELNSCISDTGDQAVEHLEQSLMATLQRCEELDMGLCGGGTHPFCRRLALITPMPRYLRMEKLAGYQAHTQITFSTHVHIGMRSGDQAMTAMSRLIPALPALIALSANSPYWRGHDTGYAAYRHRILAASRSYGMPPRFDDWDQFDAFLSAAVRSQSVKTFKDIHWDIRPHPDFGTLEIRVMDAASDLNMLRGLVAFARSLCVYLADAPMTDVSKFLPMNVPLWVAQENRFRAGLMGYEANLIVDEKGNTRPLRDYIADLIEMCGPVAESIGESSGLRIASELLRGSSGDARQRMAYTEGSSVRSVAKYLRESLVEGSMNEHRGQLGVATNP